MIQRVLLRKRMHWHRSQAIGCWCLCRLCLNRSFEGKKAFNGSCACRCAETEPSNRANTELRDTSPRGNSALVEDFGFNSSHSTRSVAKSRAQHRPFVKEKHDGDEMLVARHHSACTLHAPRELPPSGCARAPSSAHPASVLFAPPHSHDFYRDFP